LDGGVDLGLDRLVLGFEVDKRHVHDEVRLLFLCPILGHTNIAHHSSV
jgi:hypothetical protein